MKLVNITHYLLLHLSLIVPVIVSGFVDRNIKFENAFVAKQITENRLIENNTQDQDVIEFVPIDVNCIWKLKEGMNGVVIRSREEYEYVFSTSKHNSECVFEDLPDIDFERYTLFGFVSYTGGCDKPEIDYEFRRSSSVKIDFNLSIQEIGTCRVRRILTIWCLLPKQEDGVRFEIHSIETLKQ